MSMTSPRLSSWTKISSWSTEMMEKTEKPVSPIHEPLNVFDGMPDRSEFTPVWKYVVLAAIFVFWVAMLVIVRIKGQG